MTPYAPYPLNLVRDWFHRRRWWVRLLLALVLVPWFGHFAYTRMTTRPAKPFSSWNLDPGLAIPDPSVDRTREMVAAINALPAKPTLQHPATAPAGMKWASPEEFEAGQRGEHHPYQSTPTTGTFTVWMQCALDGEWTPGTRYQLREIVKYLELPATQSALEQIVALSDKPSCLTRSALFGIPNGLSQTRELARILTARARYYMAERHDFDSAVRQLDAVFHLAAGIEDDQTVICAMVGSGCRAMALHEIIRWGEEFTLTPTQTRHLQDLITGRHRDARSVITLAVRGERLLNEKWIDETYTHDNRGEGWLVPTYAELATATSPPMMLLNLFSPFFADRRRALEFTNDHLSRQTADVRWHAPPASAKSDKGSMGFTWNPALPCVTANEDALQSSRHRILFTRTDVIVAGAVTALAIAAYHKDHSQYPPDLASLVPDYLRELPRDPFADQPLRYRLDENEGYRLYSVDANGVDDGDKQFGPDHEELDFPIQRKRDLPRVDEWFLLPIDESTSQGSDDEPR
jgi:hypothetical protein